MFLMKKTIQELAPLLKNKTISPVELTRECLQRIEETEPILKVEDVLCDMCGCAVVF